MPSQLQHYVPRFVLRHFARGQKDTVHIYDKHAGKSFVASTGKVAAENGLYDFEFEGESLTLEPGLAEIEGRAAPHIENILNDGHLHLLNPLERGDLSRFFAIQFVRTPAQTQMWRELSARMESSLRAQGMSEEFFAIDPRLGSRENADRVSMARTLLAAPRNFGPVLTAKDWVLMRTDALHPYLIGDHPLVMHNARDFGLRGNIGLNVEGIEIYFPLSPDLVLGMMCDSHARDFRRALNNMRHTELNEPGRQKGIAAAREFIRAVDTGRPAVMEPENVDFLNSLQVGRAERFLFSHDGRFSLVEQLIANHPHVRYGARVDEATGKF